MADELKHGSVGTELTQAEWEGIGTHVVANQAVGDIIYASTTSQLRRLAKGTDTHVLILESGIPAWSATTGVTTVGALNGGSITSGFGTIDTGSSAITTTGLISGGSLDIDDVVVNGATIGHTDDTDLITVADGVLTVSGAVDIQGGYSNGGGAPYDGVVDAGGGGNWTTAQAGDDALDAGDYTMLIKGGAYSTLTVSTDDARIVVEPGATFSGAVVLSGNDVTLILGAGCAMSGLITLSGVNCSLICENGVDTVGVLLSGDFGYLNGGGWESLMDGGSGVNGINITGDDCIVENVAAKNTSPGPGTHSATLVSGARAVMRTVKVLEADIAGIETTSGGTDLLIDGCFLLDSDNEGMYIAGPRVRIIGCHVLSAGGDAIALKSAADNSLVIGCVVQDQTGDSVEIDTNSENCVVVGNRLDGAVDDNSGTSTVASNDETAF